MVPGSVLLPFALTPDFAEPVSVSLPDFAELPSVSLCGASAFFEYFSISSYAVLSFGSVRMLVSWIFLKRFPIIGRSLASAGWLKSRPPALIVITAAAAAAAHAAIRRFPCRVCAVFVCSALICSVFCFTVRSFWGLRLKICRYASFSFSSTASGMTSSRQSSCFIFCSKFIITPPNYSQFA